MIVDTNYGNGKWVLIGIFFLGAILGYFPGHYFGVGDGESLGRASCTPSVEKLKETVATKENALVKLEQAKVDLHQEWLDKYESMAVDYASDVGELGRQLNKSYKGVSDCAKGFFNDQDIKHHTNIINAE